LAASGRWKGTSSEEPDLEWTRDSMSMEGQLWKPHERSLERPDEHETKLRQNLEPERNEKDGVNRNMSRREAKVTKAVRAVFTTAVVPEAEHPRRSIARAMKIKEEPQGRPNDLQLGHG